MQTKILRQKIGVGINQTVRQCIKLCQIMDYFRNSFYNFKESCEKGWTEALIEISSKKPNSLNLIYTTNAIENFNRQLRKVTKAKSAFVSDDALMKILYLATMCITEKWTMLIKNWGDYSRSLDDLFW